MGRHQTRVGAIPGSRDGLSWSRPYFCEWSQVVGGRIRRLREERDWPLYELALRVAKPEGGTYSVGYFSRLERGWASAPLYVYLSIARVLEVEAGALLGRDEVAHETTAEQRVLLRFVEAAGLSPEEAIVRLVGAGAGAVAGAAAPGPLPARLEAAPPPDAPYPEHPPDPEDPPPRDPPGALSFGNGYPDDDDGGEDAV